MKPHLDTTADRDTATGAPARPAITVAALRGPSAHRTGLFSTKSRRRAGKVAVEGAPSTTRQAEVLNTAIIGNPTDERGIVIGEDRVSGAMVTHDPFTAYENKEIHSPNVLVLGSLGAGKSSLLKSVYVERPLMLSKRRAVVIDKKLREGEGEYAELTRLFGSEPYRFDPEDDRATCINLLDPIISGGGRARHWEMLGAIADLLDPTSPITSTDWKVLKLAYGSLMAKFEDARRVPVLPDLLDCFYRVVDHPEFRRPELAAAGPGPRRAGRLRSFPAGSGSPSGSHRLRPATLDAIEYAAITLKFRLERLVDDDLSGMFDRETSPWVKLQPKLTTFDISALPEEGPATSMVMLAANAWLTGLLKNQPDWRTNFIAEEGWHLLGGPGGRVIQSKSKLSRSLGLSIVAAIHHISDVPKDSQAVAMIKEAQTVHLYRQDRTDDIEDCVTYFGLEESNAAALGSLPQGDHLLKVGQTREIRVRHVRTDREIKFTETDAAMITRPRELA